MLKEHYIIFSGKCRKKSAVSIIINDKEEIEIKSALFVEITGRA